MSKETFIGGDYLEFTGGNNLNYAKEGIENIGSKVIQTGEEKGVTYGLSGKAPTIYNNFNHKWTSDKERNKEITQAELYDIVYFHLELPRDINDAKVVLRLFNENLASDDYMSMLAELHLVNRKGFVKLDFVELLETKKDDKDNFKLSKWRKVIENERGNEIELYWRIDCSEGTKKLNDKILNVFADKYCMSILKNHYRYTCNSGWIDKTHFNTTTKRNRIDIGATNLWNQVNNETGIKSAYRNGFQVIYTQDAALGPLNPRVTKKYMVRYGLNLETKKRVTMAIFQEVSMAFEEYQDLGRFIGRGDSSFEPVDLISNLLGLYSVLRNESKEIVLGRCNELTARDSLKVYRKYPGTFSESKYKNKKFTPRYFPNDSCLGTPVFPKEYQEIQPLPKSDGIFREWIDLFDIYKGVPPINRPKF